MRKILFLDIDGVLNDHEYNPVARSCSIKKECVTHLNNIIRTVDPEIVLSSAWRYMIHGKVMSIKGFEYLLRSHGVHHNVNIIGVTPTDEFIGPHIKRGSQIQWWLMNIINNYPHNKPKIVILDDVAQNNYSFDFHPLEEYVVQTNGAVGLTETEAEEVIKRFNKT